MALAETSRAPLFWAAALVVGMVAGAALGRLFDLGTVASAILTLLPMTLMIPLVRALERRSAAKGCASSAMRIYNRRMVAASLFYAVALFTAIGVTQAVAPTGVLAWLLAILPAVPIFLMLRAMARYVIEESDEYLRARVINAALVATAILLGLATTWGFLEMFGLVPHVPSWAAVPVWSIGLAVGQLVTRLRA